MKTPEIVSSPRTLVVKYKGELRVDSRLIAKSLGSNHKSTMGLIRRYSEKIEKLGPLPFKTAKVDGLGRSNTYALLNEDQAYFLLTLSRNTDKAVELKLSLVKAFKQARENAEVDKEYLPFYHEFHDKVGSVVRRAKEAGSTTGGG